MNQTQLAYEINLIIDILKKTEKELSNSLIQLKEPQNQSSLLSADILAILEKHNILTSQCIQEYINVLLGLRVTVESVTDTIDPQIVNSFLTNQ